MQDEFQLTEETSQQTPPSDVSESFDKGTPVNDLEWAKVMARSEESNLAVRSKSTNFSHNSKPILPDFKAVIRVLLVDDEDDFLEDIRDALIYQHQIPYEIEIVGMARSGEQAIQLAQQLEPDLIVMDLYMPPGLDGVQVANILKYQPIRSKVLILSAFLDLKDMDSIVKADIRGYLLKGDLAQLVDGVEKVFLGQPCFPSQVIESLFRQQFVRLKANSIENINIPWEDLSERECVMLKMRQAGLVQSEIAQKMGVSVSTIKTYARRIEKKCPGLNGFLTQD